MSRFFIPLATLALGLLLNLVGVLSFVLSDGEMTSLIPAFFGGGFLILGGLAFNPNLRKHVVHIALLLAVILGGYCIFKIPVLLANDGTALKMFAFETTAIACVIYVVLGVRSFIRARKLRVEANKAAARADAERV